MTITTLRAAMVKYGLAQKAMNAAFAAFFAGVTPENKLILWAGVLKDITKGVKATELDAATKKEYQNARTAKSRYEASLKAPANKEEKKGFWPQRRANLDKEMNMIQKLSPEKSAGADVTRIAAAYRALLQLMPK